MTWSARPRALRAYVATVAAAGLVLLMLLARGGGWQTMADAPTAFWLLAGLLLVSELAPIPVPRHGGADLVTISTIFGFALLLGWGPAPAALAYAGGSALADSGRRRPPEVVLFNAAQYAVAIALAGGTYRLLGGDIPFTPSDLWAFAAAAVVFLLGNNLLSRLAVALDHRSNLLADLREDAGAEAWTSAVMFTMAPIALLVATTSTALLALLVPPLAAVHVICRTAVAAQAARADAERATEQAQAVAAERGRLVDAEHALVHELQEGVRLREDLLATVSHELRTPLTAVRSALTLLQVRGGDLDPAQRQMLIALAKDSGERLDDLIDQLLLAARFEQVARNPAAATPTDVAALARDIAAEWQRRQPARSIVADVAGAVPVQVTDEVLHQLLASLLDNAAKHAPAGPIRLELACRGPRVLLAVEDHGPGIPPDQRERIFEPFTQLDSGSTRRVGGMGLGLYIARQLARAYGGDVAASDPLRAATGARLELSLPVATGDASAPPARPP